MNTELDAVEAAIIALDNALSEALAADEPPTFEEWAATYRRLDRPMRGLTQQLAAVRDRARSACRKACPRGPQQITVEGVGTLERCTSGATTSWQGRSIAMVLAARIADEAIDRDTGEVMPPGALAERVALAIVACAGLDAASKSWRKTDLGRFGIPADTYSTKSGGTPSIRFID